MAPITWTRDGSVAMLWMDDGENRHNPAFVAQFLAAMDAIEADPETRAVVIASKDPKNWSQGIDLAWIAAAMGERARHHEVRDFLRGLNRIFARCLTFPMPVIAAIGGHAFGDGALLACACDFRFMRSDRGFFCFPEVDLGIPFLPGMLAVVRTAFPDWKLDHMMLTGHRAGGAELAEARVVVQRRAEALEAHVVHAGRHAEHAGRGIRQRAEYRQRGVRHVERSDSRVHATGGRDGGRQGHHPAARGERQPGRPNADTSATHDP